MPNWKCIVFMEANGVGWSDLFYSVGATVLTPQNRVNAYVAVRLGLLATNAEVTATRISDDDVQGDSDLVIPETERVGGKLAGLATEADYGFAAMLLRLQSGLMYRRPLYISGFPDWVTRPEGNDGLRAAAVFQKNMGAFNALLANGGYFIKALQKGAGNQRVNIVGVGRVGVADDHAIITTDNPIPGVLVNNNIKIYNVGPIQGSGVFVGKTLNGTYRVTAIVGNAYTLDFTTQDISPWSRHGTTKKAVTIFTDINKSTFVRITHRKRGRPFGAAVGKSKAKK